MKKTLALVLMVFGSFGAFAEDNFDSTEKGIKFIECEVIRGTVPAQVGGFSWTFIHFDKSKLAYLNENSLRKHSLDEIRNGEYNLEEYDLRIEPDKLFGYQEEDPVITIDRISLEQFYYVRYADKLKVRIESECKLISGDMMVDRTIEEYKKFKLMRKL